MGADKALDAALKTVGIPVSRAFHKVTERKPTPAAYLTYALIFGGGVAHADDNVEATETTWGIDLWSRSNYADTIQAVIHALKAAEFYGVTVEAEQYERDTGYYHISFEAKYLTMEV
jgi:hypothetical protein